MVSVAVPMSSGRLTDPAGPVCWRVRSQAASPWGRIAAGRPGRCQLPGRAAGEAVAGVQPGGELPEQVVVDGAGDDRDDGGVAVGAGRRGGAAGGDPRGGLRVGFGLAGELAEGHVELDLDRLPGPVGQARGRDQAAAGFGQRVMVPLRSGADVLRPGPLAERVQHGLQRGRRLRGEIGVEAGVALEMRLQVQAPLGEPVVAVAGIRPGAQGPDPLPREPDIRELRAAGRQPGEDLVGAGPVSLG